jgi:MATE family multidrug resistance protein
VLGIGLSYGSTPLIAAAQGNQNMHRIKLVFGNSMWLCTLSGIVISLLMLSFTPLFKHLGQPAEVVEKAIPYYRVMVCSMLPLMIFQGYRQFLEGLSLTKPPMLLSLACNVVNIALGYGLIYGYGPLPEMGMLGAAVATFVARSFMAASAFWYVKMHKELAHFHFGWSRSYFSWSHLKRLLSIGLPAGMQMVLEVGAFSAAALFIGWIGTNSLAAHQIAISLAATTYMLASGISAAATIRVGTYRGAGEEEQMQKAGWAAFTLAFLFMAVSSMGFVLLRNVLPLIFVKDAEVVAIASQLLILAAVFQLSDGVHVAGLGALRGLEDVKVPTIITVIAYWVIALPVGYIIGFKFNQGAPGVWAGLALGLSVAAVLLSLRFRALSRLNRKIFTKV